MALAPLSIDRRLAQVGKALNLILNFPTKALATLQNFKPIPLGLGPGEFSSNSLGHYFGNVIMGVIIRLSEKS
ncbi:hypothetical protein BWK47_07385 [Synechocystis sp. CACIAM 05]|nr:hypothetical protein BWK47_07385 [Synechocystis sp. CACIAM 05]